MSNCWLSLVRTLLQVCDQAERRFNLKFQHRICFKMQKGLLSSNSYYKLEILSASYKYSIILLFNPAVCKQFSSMIAGQTSTILQQLISLLVQETLKVKSSQIDATLLEIGLRAMSNCCSCIEGRLQSLKVRHFTGFSTLTKQVRYYFYKF